MKIIFTLKQEKLLKRTKKAPENPNKLFHYKYQSNCSELCPVLDMKFLRIKSVSQHREDPPSLDKHLHISIKICMLILKLLASAAIGANLIASNPTNQSTTQVLFWHFSRCKQLQLLSNNQWNVEKNAQTGNNTNFPQKQITFRMIYLPISLMYLWFIMAAFSLIWL